MESPLQLSFREIELSPAVEARVREYAARLDRYFDRITGCRVLLEARHRHHRKGTLYHVRVELEVPGERIVVDREPAERHTHEDLYVALHDAFRATRRRLQDYARDRRAEVKSHEPRPHGRIARLFPDEGYGFLVTDDGRELYFHRNSVLDAGYDELEVGTEVWLAEEIGEKGPQATTVRRTGKRRLAAS